MNFDFNKIGQSNVAVKEVSTPVTKSVIDENKYVVPETNKQIFINGLSDEILNLPADVINKRASEAVTTMNKIKSEVSAEFVEREDEINMLILALISATNAFLHGPAGTGKSALTESISSRIINSNYFRVLVGKTTEPGEIFGPVSINSMKQDKYKVNTTGKLPEAHVAFIDEVFKCNSAVLNSLLTIMNEKIFFNDVQQEVPLISVFGASNEYIEDDSLVALYDRFLLRWHVNYIQDSNNRIDLFKNFLDNRSSGSKFNARAALTTIDTRAKIELEDLYILNEKAKDVAIGAKILKAYNSLFIQLEKLNITVSDRRKNESLKVLQASALLDGRDFVELSDFEALKYTLWNDESEIELISDLLSKIANPNDSKYKQYKQVLDEHKAKIAMIESDSKDGEYAFNKAIAVSEAVDNLQYATSTIQGIINGLSEGNERNKFQGLLDDIHDFINQIKSEVII